MTIKNSDQNVRKCIGQTVRSIRNHYRLTQRQLAELTGLRRATISDIENGKIDVRISTLIILADIFDTSISFLLGEL